MIDIHAARRRRTASRNRRQTDIATRRLNECALVQNDASRRRKSDRAGLKGLIGPGFEDEAEARRDESEGFRDLEFGWL